VGPDIYSDYVWFFQGKPKGESSMKSVWKMYIGLFLLAPVFAFAGINVYGGMKTEEVSSHIKLAAFAPSLEVMHDEIGEAIKAAESNGFTKGYTSVFKQTEDDNVGAWFLKLNCLYEKLSDGQDVIFDQEIGLEPVAMKARTISLGVVNESMVMQEMRGSLVTPEGSARMPDGIWRFPNNTGMAWLAILGLPAFIGGLFLLISRLNE